MVALCSAVLDVVETAQTRTHDVVDSMLDLFGLGRVLCDCASRLGKSQHDSHIPVQRTQSFFDHCLNTPATGGRSSLSLVFLRMQCALPTEPNNPELSHVMRTSACSKSFF
jgi:hypothetical protein